MLRGICVIFIASNVRGLHIRPVRSLADALVYATISSPSGPSHRPYVCEKPPPPKKYHSPGTKMLKVSNVEVVKSIEMEFDSALGKFVPVREETPRVVPEVPLLSPKTTQDLGEIFRKFERESKTRRPGSADAKNFHRGRYKHAGFPLSRTESPQAFDAPSPVLLLRQATKHPNFFNIYYKNWKNGIVASERPRFRHIVWTG